jgi:uncharacterized OsmC-like protein
VSVHELAAALERVESVLSRRPTAALQEDSAGLARWKGGLKVVSRHPCAREIETDMPAELGGGGGISPGWMVRAGLSACAATCIAMVAARQGIELDLLEVETASCSDLRGFLRIAAADSARVYPGPQRLRMSVRIAARGVAPERLRQLVDASEAFSPMLAVVRDAQSVEVSVEVAG